MTHPYDPHDPDRRSPDGFNHPEGYSAYEPVTGEHSTDPAGAQFGYAPVAPPRNGAATASLVLGILSLLIVLLAPLGGLAALIAIVCGVLGLRNARRIEHVAPGAGRRGRAITGLVLAAVSLLITFALMSLIGSVLTSGVIEQCQHLDHNTEAMRECIADFVVNDPNSPVRAR
ncbi:DUF4190 domain-containing protein [Corynebacterium sp.]|uniref:DUF4190 domain-containing protein n=1 Tax=Corynebacterium sp. TaxID=1720 RepID=UPI002A91E9A0|nr:DUF4190 domain-containing protein [Corynebacterium sp.]MDY5785963.1 DUF4190 domain-containing protein [Corynebacterium sp.]